MALQRPQKILKNKNLIDKFFNDNIRDFLNRSKFIENFLEKIYVNRSFPKIENFINNSLKM